MFVRSGSFGAKHKKNPSCEISIFRVENTDEPGWLCRMNLTVHRLESDIRHGGDVNSYHEDPHKAVGPFAFALANPPFNVNAVDKDRLKDAVGPGHRFPDLPCQLDRFALGLHRKSIALHLTLPRSSSHLSTVSGIPGRYHRHRVFPKPGSAPRLREFPS